MQAKILRDWAKRHKIKDFFDIGANGVCHALFPEKGFIRPGYTVIMGDSHTCTHGAFGAFAAGVGTTDLEVGIYKGVCSFRAPKSMKINITGTLQSRVTAKDVILSIIKKITVNGATDRVIEFTGPVVDSFSMAARMTLCNMAVEDAGNATNDYSSVSVVIVGARNSKVNVKTLDQVQAYWTCYLNQIGITNVTEQSDLSGF